MLMPKNQYLDAIRRRMLVEGEFHSGPVFVTNLLGLGTYRKYVLFPKET